MKYLILFIYLISLLSLEVLSAQNNDSISKEKAIQNDTIKKEIVISVDETKQKETTIKQIIDSIQCKEIDCFVNGKEEKISCNKYKYVLDLHWNKKLKLDDANVEIKQLKKRVRDLERSQKSKTVFSNDMKNIDNLPVDVYFQSKSYSVYIINPKRNEIQLFNKTNKGSYHDFKSINTLLNRSNRILLFAMNAGMYKENRAPLGLYISKGEKTQSINLKKKNQRASNFYDLDPNGVFALDKANNAYIVTSKKYSSLKNRDNIVTATQSGPMMVIDNKINSHFRKGSNNLNIRNGVGVNNLGRVVFVISNEPINFYEFSEFFRDVLDCSNALYLDGVISKMYLPELDKSSLNNSNHLGPIITVVK